MALGRFHSVSESKWMPAGNVVELLSFLGISVLFVIAVVVLLFSYLNLKTNKLFFHFHLGPTRDFVVISVRNGWLGSWPELSLMKSSGERSAHQMFAMLSAQ